MRDNELEKKLQKVLDDGKNVWVIGDVHGFNKTLRRLVGKLILGPNDYVILLGDLIDRGPNSYDVIQFVKSLPNIVCVKGNHEEMMAEVLSIEDLESPGVELMTWLYTGGLATITSYINAYTDENGEESTTKLDEKIEQDKKWIDQLPSEIVLNDWRLVHAGYNPGIDLDNQTDDDLLHIRETFHLATKPIDKHRTVLFGHTPTAGLPGYNKESWGQVWYSSLVLADGRSAAIGLDTCLFHNLDAPAVLTAYNLQNGMIIQQERIEKWNRKAIRQANEV